MAPAFSEQERAKYEDAQIEVLEKFCETLKEGTAKGEWGKKWDFANLATYLGFDLMGVLVFGTDFGSVQREENRDLAESIISASRFLYCVREQFFFMAYLK